MNQIDLFFKNISLNIIDWLNTLPIFIKQIFLPRLESPVSFIDVFIIGILFLILFFYFDQKPGFTFNKDTILKATMITLSGFFTYILVVIIKDIFARPRPFIDSDLYPWFYYGSYDGFPSGHSAVFMALAISTFWYHRRLGVIYIVIALVIGLTRIIFGLHYLSDVLAGFVVGVFIAILGRLIWEKIRSYYNKNTK